MSEFGTVFVIIPVFNRLDFTRKCLENLSRQRYPRVVPVVSDGGSTDGTPEAIAREFPFAVVLTSTIELWWAGATAMGVEYAIRTGNPERDFILFLNNDTEVPEDYIAVLVRIARCRNCAVGAKILDASDPARCLDAGEYIDWQTYTFPVKTNIAPDELGCDNIDVLPGRGSLVPLSFILQVGNIAAHEFPHYIADYDFFLRIRKAGIPLFITYETSVMAHIEETGIMPAEKRLGWLGAGRQLFSRRSMTNVVDHWRFIRKHAPADLRSRTLVRLIWSAVDVTPLGLVRTVYFRILSLRLVHFVMVGPRFFTQLVSTSIDIQARQGPNLVARWTEDGHLLAILASMITNVRQPWIISERACFRRGLTIEDFTSCGLIAQSRVGWLICRCVTLRALSHTWSIPLLVASTLSIHAPRRRARAKLYLLKRGTRSIAPTAKPAENRGSSDPAVLQ